MTEPIENLIGKIHNESCLQTMARMPDESLDMVLTSPPYDNLRTYFGDWEFDFEVIAKEYCELSEKRLAPILAQGNLF